MRAYVPRFPFSVDPLISEAKHRARRRRLSIAVGVATTAAVAVTLSQQPNGAPPSSVSAASGSASKQLGRTENQARLERGGPVKLLPGRVTTDALGMPATLEVSHHWYGEQGPGLLRLAKSLAGPGLEVSLSSGGIEVQALDSPLAGTARRLETLPGIRIHDVSPIRLGRDSGRRYRFYLSHLQPLGPGDNVGRGKHEEVILLGVGRRTIVIKKEPNLLAPAYLRRAFRFFNAAKSPYATAAEVERVIQSLRFHP